MSFIWRLLLRLRLSCLWSHFLFLNFIKFQLEDKSHKQFRVRFSQCALQDFLDYWVSKCDPFFLIFKDRYVAYLCSHIFVDLLYESRLVPLAT